MPRFIASLAIVALLAFTLYYSSSHNANAGELPKAEIEGIVKEYLLSNPEVVIDALTAYQDKQAKEAEQKAKSAIKDNKALLFDNPNTPSIGPADADIVIAEFFDYHCGYCKHMLPVVTKLLEKDKKVRIVFHEMPILSKDSRLASKAALAVFNLNPNKYFAYHTALMNASGKYTEATLTAEAEKLGIDAEAFKTKLKDEAIDKTLGNSAKAAQAIGLSGTPAFVIGDELIPGASSLEAIQDMIAKQRAK